jgi:UDP-hydrolysing UDP-N-acetyl-D-glucosamine 2-epimerase
MRKICVITGSRAEYGLLQWLMSDIQDDHSLELQIIATGMHLSPEFGLTFRNIEEDGFTISAKVEMLLSSDTSCGITKSFGLGVIGFADVFERLDPDIVVVLGDRYEVLAAAQAAMFHRIPVAHIAGGESTEAMLDEAIRHSITKIATMHFPAGEEQKRRIIQMGEQPSNVFVFGKPGLDSLHRLKLFNQKKLEHQLQLKFKERIFLITFHPVTLENKTSSKQCESLLEALSNFQDTTMIFTKPNSDEGGRIIIELISNFVENDPKNYFIFSNLGQHKYLSCVNLATVLIGNSSSGMIEAPVFKTPTINIGNRQHGRISADSVINCTPNPNHIIKSIRKALDPQFKKEVDDMIPPFNSDGLVSTRIKDVIKEIDISEKILMKKFYKLTNL